jgi:hypothetical protein
VHQISILQHIEKYTLETGANEHSEHSSKIYARLQNHQLDIQKKKSCNSTA